MEHEQRRLLVADVAGNVPDRCLGASVMIADDARKIAADLLAGPLLNSPSIPCMLAMPMIKVPKKKSDKPITAQVCHSQEPMREFGCYRAVPTCEE